MGVKCIIIGAKSRAGEVQKLLQTSDVPTLVVAHNQGYAAILDECVKQQKSLVVVAVYCGDFPNDGGYELLTSLHKKLPKNVSLHALVATEEDPDVVELLDSAGVTETLFASPLQPIDAAKSIKQRWFKGQQPRMKDAEAISGHPLDAALNGGQKKAQRNSSITTAREVRPLDKVPPPLVATTTVALVAPRPAVASPRAPAPPPTASACVVAEAPKAESVFTQLMKTVRHNSPLAPVAKPIAIAGLHGRIVELDPRRVRPLPENPRSESNPGFSEGSLRSLGESIKTVGQVEEILVCPITDHPDYDAQLVDGECRQRAAMLMDITVWATVREDITPEMLYFVSVVRNIQKEPPTTREYMRMVAVFRGVQHGMTLVEVARTLKKSVPFVSQHELLNKLHLDVQVMLDDRVDGKDAERGKEPRLASTTALLLIDLPQEKQRAAAEEIVAKRMNYIQSRRYVLNLRRGLGLKSNPAGRARHAEQFDSLATLTRRSIDSFGVYLDLPSAELLALLSNRRRGERSDVSDDLRALAGNLIDLAQRIEPEK